MTVSPFNWLEASYFYYRPDDLYWSDFYVIGKGDYLDKGFNIKFTYSPKNSNMPKIALGLDDFAGTGYFAKEYVVLTKQLENMNISFGTGWGKFAGDSSYKNPLSYLKDSFEARPALSEKLELGGVPLYDTWFRGPIGFFGGIELYVPKANGLKLKLEYDPFNYFDFSAGNRFDADPLIRSKDSDINIGLSYPVNEFINLQASFIKGNTFNFSFTIGTNLNKKIKKNKNFKPIINNNNFGYNGKKEFYRDLLDNLNRNNLFLQTANIKNQDLKIAIQSDNYRNHIAQSSRAAFIAKNVLDFNNLNDVEVIEITNINVGLELNKISYRSSNFEDFNKNIPIELIRKTTEISQGSKEYLNNEFVPKVNFPQVFTSYGPIIINHIGSPDRFYYGGLEFEHNSEIQFTRNLILNTKLNASISNNFDEKYYRPESDYLHHVRSDILKYLQSQKNYITQMQLDYIWSPYKNMYAKASIGIFEKMYGGIGGEVLYKPFDSNFSFGVELHSVKQRAFEQKLHFLDYRTNTGHINFNYYHPKTGLHLKTSYGKYLAKDKGFTFDLSRQTQSGFRAGFFFSRTNITYEQFGEGSFDKGFYIQIPLDLFTRSHNGDFYNFKIKTLTRDGGAKLNLANDIFGLINNSNRSSIDNKWNWNEY